MRSAGAWGGVGYVGDEVVWAFLPDVDQEARERTIREIMTLRGRGTEEIGDLLADRELRGLQSALAAPHLRFLLHVRADSGGAGLFLFDRLPRRLAAHTAEVVRDSVHILPHLLAADPDRHPLTARPRAVVREAALGIVEVELDGVISGANPAAAEVLGLPREAIQGRPLYQVLGLEEEEEPLQEMVSGLFPHYVTEIHIRHPDHGDRDVRINANLVRDTTGKASFLLVMVEDVTIRSREEEQLREAKEAAESANRMKSTFLATMSHELRTPLNSIIGFSRLLRDRAADRLDAKERVFVGKVHDNGVHLLGLLNDILDLSKIESGRTEVVWENVDLRTLAGDVVETLRVKADEKGLSLVLECPDRMSPLEADEGKLRQVLMNLAGNAIKFTDQGEVRVRIEAPEGGRPEKLHVMDTGPGIAPDRREAVFEPFTQEDGSTSRTHGGTGLGLAISREMAKLMGFRLILESDLGRGSTFTMLFGEQRVYPADKPRS